MKVEIQQANNEGSGLIVLMDQLTNEEICKRETTNDLSIIEIVTLKQNELLARSLKLNTLNK